MSARSAGRPLGWYWPGCDGACSAPDGSQLYCSRAVCGLSSRCRPPDVSAVATLRSDLRVGAGARVGSGSVDGLYLAQASHGIAIARVVLVRVTGVTASVNKQTSSQCGLFLPRVRDSLSVSSFRAGAAAGRLIVESYGRPPGRTPACRRPVGSRSQSVVNRIAPSRLSHCLPVAGAGERERRQWRMPVPTVPLSGSAGRSTGLASRLLSPPLPSPRPSMLTSRRVVESTERLWDLGYESPDMKPAAWEYNGMHTWLAWKKWRVTV